MYGLIAIRRPEASTATLRSDYLAMASRLAHRGRDASGVVGIPRDPQASMPAPWRCRGPFPAEPPAAAIAALRDAAGFLGHHRLAIVDPDQAATQPLVAEAAGVALALNGEIYNYPELRHELVGSGHRFATRSDAEVALRAWVEWDTACLARFVGDFAIVVYDHRRRALYAARDRLGARPLFAWRHDGVLALSSEVKGLLDLAGFAPALDEAVAFPYLVADFPTGQTLRRSFLRGVESLPPGCCCRWALDRDGAAPPQTKRYWCLDEAVAAVPPAPTARAAVERFDAALADAVRLRLRCDVPVAALLSGGLDSPSVLWHAVREAGPLPTFSAAFPGHACDESGAIEAVVGATGVPNDRWAVRFEALLERLDELVYVQDEPFCTLNVACQAALLERAAASGARVVLDGAGADELLGGYDDYRLPARADAGRGADEALRRFREWPADRLAAWHADAQRERRRVPYVLDDARAAMGRDPRAVDRPLAPDYRGRWDGSYLKHALRRSVIAGWMNKSIEWDLRAIDRSGMWRGIEGRSPFLDHRLVALVLSMPPRMLVRRDRTKLPLRRSMRGRLPEAVRRNPRKIGFEFPFCPLLRGSLAFRATLRDRLEGFDGLGLVDPALVRRELARIVTGQSTDYNLWRVVNLAAWSRQYLQRRPVPGADGCGGRLAAPAPQSDDAVAVAGRGRA
jgi:asparagine synthase (glutamine-hydrolysing)